MSTRPHLELALTNARERTDELFRIVRPDALYERPIAERHRIVFYVGHVEAFDWNLFRKYALDVPPFHPEFHQLFAFGIDPPPGKLPSDQPSDWPALPEVERYNRRTREVIDAALHHVPDQLLHAAIEHRLMHAETLAYILHNLPYEKKVAHPSDIPSLPGTPSPRMIEIPAGAARLGSSADAPFGWDNEFHEHSVDVPAFSIARYKVTNREYLEFVEAGAAAPFFWEELGGRRYYRGMFARIPLPPDWPVFVTHREAQAYAEWRGMRLPTEAEFHRAAGAAPAHGNFDFRRWGPVPVNADDNGFASPSQMFGNGWEWTSTLFGPFPGFQPFPFYANYSEPFFDNQHYVLKGASPRTAACFLRPSFRNWFRPAYPYIYATFRLVES